MKMRRTLIITICFGLTFIGNTIAQNNVHPRLFFQQSEVELLKSQHLTTHTEEWTSLLALSEKTVQKVNFENLTSKLLHHESENIMGIALVQMIDPSKPYMNYLKKSILQFCSWPKWDKWIAGEIKTPINDLALGQALIGFCGAYDIQYDQFSEVERKYIEDKLVKIADRFHDEYSRFHTDRLDIMNCNHGTNAYGGLSAVLYTVDNLDSDIKAKWEKSLDDKFDRLTSLMNTDMSDGASDEGATYFMFQLKTYLQWFEILRNGKFKSETLPYADLDWFKNTSTYCVYSILPGGKDNFGGLARFADCNPDFWGDPKCVFPLIAKIFKDPIAKWIANDMDVNNTEIWRDDKGKSISKSGPHYDVWRYIWKDASVKSIGPSTLPNWHFFEDLGIFAWRSSWNNDASYFTCRSGQHYQGHGQPDDGQFMLHKAGVPYIVDLGYSLPKATSEHNVLLVNGKGQIGEGQSWPDFGFFPDNKDNWGNTDFSIVGNNPQAKAYFNIVLDPTNLYDSTCLKSWKREFIYLDDFYVLHDVILNDKEAEAELLLNSYVSESGKKDTYEFENTRTLNPFVGVSQNNWLIKPSVDKDVEALVVKDLSGNNWKHQVKESWFSDNYVRKIKGDGMVQQGYHISSKAIGKNLIATKVFGFENNVKDLDFEKLEDGILIKRGKKDIGRIVWTSTQMSGYYKSGCISTWFFRNATSMKLSGLDMNSTAPVNGTISLSGNKVTLLIKSENKVEISLKGLPKKFNLPEGDDLIKTSGKKTKVIKLPFEGTYSL